MSICKVENNIIFDIKEEVIDDLNKNYKKNIENSGIENPDYIWYITDDEVISFLTNTLDFSRFNDIEFIIDNKFLDTYYKTIAADIDYTSDPLEIIPNIICEAVLEDKFLEDYGN